MRVDKFGGTSMASAAAIEEVIARISDGAERAVVVSAMAGVTDALYQILADIADGRCWRAHLDALAEKHVAAAGDLLQDSAVYRDFVGTSSRELEEVLRGVKRLGSVGQDAESFVVGHGELWSARLLCAALKDRGRDAVFLDARDVLVVASLREPRVVWEATADKLAAWRHENHARTTVVTGFICRTKDGVPATLLRNGSDHSAAIFAKLLGAERLTIWTDVDGVMSADPRRVPDAQVTAALSYQEAVELSYFGAEVLHPQTMGPAIDGHIPIHLRNTFAPEKSGTIISAEKHSTGTIKGFASIDDIALINVEGRGMIGIPGVAQRVFGTLREAGINVILIAQASSEQSISFAVRQADSAGAKDALDDAFFGELERGRISHIAVTEDCTILAAVGDDMAHVPGVAGRLLSALGKVGVNIRAMAQGVSERNISLVIDKREATRALRAVHAAFYLSEQTLAIGLIGPGLIGAELLRQLGAQKQALKERYNIHLVIRAVARSETMLLGAPTVAADNWREAIKDAQPTDLEAFVSHLDTERIPHAVVVDCTATDAFADDYAAWFKRRIHVITPNKKPNTGSLARYDALRQTATAHHAHYFYEATVGAGLPVISTLRDLLATGDEVKRVRGVLSGTLSYLMNAYQAEDSFAALVEEARALGYTEPDPRDDLSGVDVARKALILARELGLRLEMADLKVESLIPDALANASKEEFLAHFADFDDVMRARAQAAGAENKLAYVADIDVVQGRVVVGLQAVARASALGSLRGTDNLIAFHTRRYHDEPLIVRGPGAGPEVTAGGVFADILRLCAHLGART